MLKQDVIKLIREEIPYHDILEELDLYNYELLYMYYKWLFQKKNDLPSDVIDKMKIDYKNNCSFINLQQDKILLISDTHIGSKYENLMYLEQAKEVAQKRRITKLFHGGDIGDGFIESEPIYKGYYDQIEYLLAAYSFFEDMDQYIIGGNHDRRYKDNELDLLKLLPEVYPNINPVGYYQAYFKVYNKLISFEHNSKIRKKNKLIKPKFIIAGHSHKGVFKQNEVKLPTLSDSNPNNEFIDSEPGFDILITKKDKTGINLNFERYITTENGPEKAKVKTYYLKN